VNEVILSFDNVSKNIGETCILKGVSLDLHRHEVVCLIGASGSGKSTLLRCANMLEALDGGDIRFMGASLRHEMVDPDLVRRSMGMVFQSFNLFPHMSVLDNVMLAPVRALGPPREQVRSEALDLLERIGLRDRADAFPDRLSGGHATTCRHRSVPRHGSPSSVTRRSHFSP
jgi:polar amino acid transport system ATP-binding protein